MNLDESNRNSLLITIPRSSRKIFLPIIFVGKFSQKKLFVKKAFIIFIPVTKMIFRNTFPYKISYSVIILRFYLSLQLKYYNRLKETLEKDECIVHVDYSENYKNKQQDEIQSAYFGHATF